MYLVTTPNLYRTAVCTCTLFVPSGTHVNLRDYIISYMILLLCGNLCRKHDFRRAYKELMPNFRFLTPGAHYPTCPSGTYVFPRLLWNLMYTADFTSKNKSNIEVFNKLYAVLEKCPRSAIFLLYQATA